MPSPLRPTSSLLRYPPASSSGAFIQNTGCMLAAVPREPNAIGVAKNAPHPHAALLFADFVLSPEGQELLLSMGRVPVSTKVQSHMNNFKYTLIDPVTVLDESEKWEKVWNELFMKR